MSDYIRREDAIETLKHLLYETAMNNLECAPQYADVCEDIAENRIDGYVSAIPAADVRENVRGEWVKKESPSMIWCECSICGYKPRNNDYSYFCPNCGADMRGEQDG